MQHFIPLRLPFALEAQRFGLGQSPQPYPLRPKQWSFGPKLKPFDFLSLNLSLKKLEIHLKLNLHLNLNFR